jgi:cytochrome b involved in lipid metabolism
MDFITPEELSKKDLCVCIDEKVYDVSHWVHFHPGGYNLIANNSGTDISAIFHAFHISHGSSKSALKLLNRLPHVANMRQQHKQTFEEAFEQLRKRVETQGISYLRFSLYNIFYRL